MPRKDPSTRDRTMLARERQNGRLNLDGYNAQTRETQDAVRASYRAGERAYLSADLCDWLAFLDKTEAGAKRKRRRTEDRQAAKDLYDALGAPSRVATPDL